MKVEVVYDSIEEPKQQKEGSTQKMSLIKFILLLVLMSLLGVCVYAAIDGPHLSPIKAPAAEVFQQTSRRFSRNIHGLEIPMKFVSGTEIIKQKIFLASVFIKFPLDLIDNEIFVGRIIDLVRDEIEDGFDRVTNTGKRASAEFQQPCRKVFEEVIQVVYLVAFEKGSSTFYDFARTIVQQFSESADHYYYLLNEFRAYGRFIEEGSNEYAMYTVGDEPTELTMSEEINDLDPRIGLIKKSRK